MKAKLILSFLVVLLLMVMAGCQSLDNPSRDEEQTPNDVPGQSEDKDDDPTVDEDEVTFYLVQVLSEGQTAPQGATMTGCNDSYLVPIQMDLKSGETANVQTALTALFEYDVEVAGSQINALDQSELKVDKVSIEDGKTIVELSGQVMIAGTCSAPRLKDQVEETVEYYVSGDYEIRLNGEEKNWRCLTDQSGACE